MTVALREVELSIFIFDQKASIDLLSHFYHSFKISKHYFILLQVKEACKKASEAELIAKDRLLQMNYELGIHCRITVFHLKVVEVFYLQF